MTLRDNPAPFGPGRIRPWTLVAITISSRLANSFSARPTIWIRSEAAFAKLCRVCPIPASSGKTSRHRLNRGGHRQANTTLYRVVVVRMRAHQPTIEYVRRRTAEGKSKSEIIRCLKRFVAREIFGYLCCPHRGAPPEKAAAPAATMTLTAQRHETLHPMVERAA